MRITLFTCFLCIWFPSISAADETDHNKLARDAYVTFCQAFNKKDLDGVLRVVDVPWLARGKQVVRDRAELRTIWEGFLVDPNIRRRLPWTDEFKVEPISALRELAQNKRDSLTKEDKEFLSKLDDLGVNEDDRAVIDGLTVFIMRLREGEAKIVARYDVPFKIQGKIFP
jgi:hypothetical protein